MYLADHVFKSRSLWEPPMCTWGTFTQHLTAGMSLESQIQQVEAVLFYKKLRCRRETAGDASWCSCIAYSRPLPRVPSFIINYFRFTSVYNSILFSVFGVPADACCHEQDSLMRGISFSSSAAIKKCCRLVLTTPPSKCWRHSTVHQLSIPKLKIAIFARNWGSPSEYCLTV